MIPAEQSNAIVSMNGGPSTREGKEIARWNATRHGVRSPAPVVPGVGKPQGRRAGQSLAGRTSGVCAGRKGSDALLEIAPRHAF